MVARRYVAPGIGSISQGNISPRFGNCRLSRGGGRNNINEVMYMPFTFDIILAEVVNDIKVGNLYCDLDIHTFCLR
jgi:hypothetical protein